MAWFCVFNFSQMGTNHDCEGGKILLRGCEVLRSVTNAGGKLDRGTTIQEWSGFIDSGRGESNGRGWGRNHDCSLQRNFWGS